jgi:hypothetical protein
VAKLAQTMAHERACERLIVAYAHALDFGRLEAALAVFSPEAVFEALGTVLTGPDEIARALGVLTDHHPVTRHLLASIAIHPHADGSADGISYLTIHGERSGPLLVGHLRDRFVAGDAGWRIERRRLDAVFVDESFAWPAAL